MCMSIAGIYPSIGEHRCGEAKLTVVGTITETRVTTSVFRIFAA